MLSAQTKIKSIMRSVDRSNQHPNHKVNESQKCISRRLPAVYEIKKFNADRAVAS